jgi:hypothetical protein
MSAAAVSIAAYAVYLLGQGLTLLLIPNVILPILGLPQALDVWIRVVGMTVVFFSIYYFAAARYEWRPFFALTIVTRLSVPVVFAALIVAGLAPGALILLTPADILFSAWTFFALHGSMSAAAASVG